MVADIVVEQRLPVEILEVSAQVLHARKRRRIGDSLAYFVVSGLDGNDLVVGVIIPVCCQAGDSSYRQLKYK